MELNSQSKVDILCVLEKSLKFNFLEDAERINDAWIYINPLKASAQKSKMIEGQLVKDSESGIWYYEYRDISLSFTDDIEYWMYIEKYGVGYYSTDTISINGN